MNERQKRTGEVTLEQEQLKAITSRLDALIRLTVLGLPETVSEDTMVSVLSQMGFQPNEIATMIGSTANAVRIRLHRIRKKTKGNQKVTNLNLTRQPQGIIRG